MDPTPNAPGYRDLPAELAALARRIRSHARRSTKTLLALGKDLNAAQAILEDHRTLGSLASLIRKAGLSPSYASRAMSAWRNFGECCDSQHQPFEVLITLGRDPEAVAEGVARFTNGDRLSIREAKEILQKVSPLKTQPTAARTILVEEYNAGSVSVVVNHNDATDDELIQMLALTIRKIQERGTEKKNSWGFKKAA